MLNRYIYTTKAERSVSKQGHLQPRCHGKARSSSRELYNGLFTGNQLMKIVVQAQILSEEYALSAVIHLHTESDNHGS